MKHVVEITQYTDPYCTWCWGSEPILRHLQEVYGEQLSLRFVMGGLVEDSTTFADPMNGIGGANWLEPIAAHWKEASERHGMPVDVTDFMKTDFTSTWPSNIAYEAAKLQDADLADRLLRRMREAAATEGRDLSRHEVLSALAAEVGLDFTRFETDFHGQAADEFARDRLECMQRDVRGFPSFLVTVDGRERLVRGWRSFEQIVGIIDLLAAEPVERLQPAFDDEQVLDFVERYESAAVREVAETFAVSDSLASAALDRLVTKGVLELPAPGLLYRNPATPSCDAFAGTCQ